MKRQIGLSVTKSAAWLAVAGAIGSVSAADFTMKYAAFTDPDRLDWTALSGDAQRANVAQLDWAGLSK